MFAAVLDASCSVQLAGCRLVQVVCIATLGVGSSVFECVRTINLPTGAEAWNGLERRQRRDPSQYSALTCPMNKIILSGILAFGLCAGAFAADKKDYPPISLVGPGSKGSGIPRDQFVVLVVESGFISHEKNPIPGDSVVTYVDNALKAQNASYIAVHIREGIKYGDVVRALDTLRQTAAASIGVSMIELPVGRDP